MSTLDEVYEVAHQATLDAEALATMLDLPAPEGVNLTDTLRALTTLMARARRRIVELEREKAALIARLHGEGD